MAAGGVGVAAQASVDLAAGLVSSRLSVRNPPIQLPDLGNSDAHTGFYVELDASRAVRPRLRAGVALAFSATGSGAVTDRWPDVRVHEYALGPCGAFRFAEFVSVDLTLLGVLRDYRAAPRPAGDAGRYDLRPRLGLTGQLGRLQVRMSAEQGLNVSDWLEVYDNDGLGYRPRFQTLAIRFGVGYRLWHRPRSAVAPGAG